MIKRSRATMAGMQTAYIPLRSVVSESSPMHPCLSAGPQTQVPLVPSALDSTPCCRSLARCGIVHVAGLKFEVEWNALLSVAVAQSSSASSSCGLSTPSGALRRDCEFFSTSFRPLSQR